MRWKGLLRKAGGQHLIGAPSVPSRTDQERPARGSGPQPVIDRKAVQYLDRVRAIYRPTGNDASTPGLERFIGQEDLFRHVGMGPDGAQPMMQCPSSWPNGVTWVPIRDLEILEILEDQDVRAG